MNTELNLLENTAVILIYNLKELMFILTKLQVRNIARTCKNE